MMLSPLQIFCRYTIFAVVATIINLAVQHVIFGFYQGPSVLIIALVASTGISVTAKYLLDRRWVFYDIDSRINTQLRQFSIYTLMGVLTTVIFWGIEWAFYHILGGQVWRDVGALIGLSIGYFIKYQLDKRFVFGHLIQVSEPSSDR